MTARPQWKPGEREAVAAIRPSLFDQFMAQQFPGDTAAILADAKRIRAIRLNLADELAAAEKQAAFVESYGEDFKARDERDSFGPDTYEHR